MSQYELLMGLQKSMVMLIGLMMILCFLELFKNIFLPSKVNKNKSGPLSKQSVKVDGIEKPIYLNYFNEKIASFSYEKLKKNFLLYLPTRYVTDGNRILEMYHHDNLDVTLIALSSGPIAVYSHKSLKVAFEALSATQPFDGFDTNVVSEMENLILRNYNKVNQ